MCGNPNGEAPRREVTDDNRPRPHGGPFPDRDAGYHRSADAEQHTLANVDTARDVGVACDQD